MADGPGEDSFDALRAGRDDPRAHGSEASAAASSERPVGSRGRWRMAAAGLLAVGVIAAGIGLAPMLRERASPEVVTPQPAPLPAVEAAASDDTQALARRLAELESELAAMRAIPSALPAGASTADAGAAAFGSRLQALEAEARRLAEAEAATAGKLAALASDMSAAGVTSGAVAAATAEARDVFLLVSLRRLLDRGRPLGAFDPLLRRQFGTREPSAVAALVAWSGAPIGRAGLAERLDALDGAAADDEEADSAGGAPGFWGRLWQRLSGVVEIRQGPEEVAAPMVRARARMAGGDLPAAIALVAAEPETAERAAWLEDARRLQAAEDALDRLELLVVQSATVPPAG